MSMIGSLGRFAALTMLALMAAGCASTSNMRYSANGYSGRDYRASRPETAAEASAGSIQTPDRPMQCVTYARERTGIALRGDASGWWEQAQGRFSRRLRPNEGAIMVLTGYAGAKRAHLAVVRDVVSTREIHIDHANWLNDGAIYLNDAVADVSPENNWSEVRVFNLRTHAWGIRTYLVQGFIGPGADRESLRVAERD